MFGLGASSSDSTDGNTFEDTTNSSSNSNFRKVKRQHNKIMQMQNGGDTSSMGNGSSMKAPGTINGTKASSPTVTTGMKQWGVTKLNPLKRKMYKQ